jgi:hypothetical protein
MSNLLIQLLDFFPREEISEHSRILAENPNITPEFILINIGDNDLFIYNVCINMNVPITFFETHIEMPWNYDCLSWRSDITINFVLSNLDKNWNWYELSGKIPLQDILTNSQLFWDWRSISRKREITPEILLSYPNLEWDFEMLTRRPEITMEFIDSHPEFNWQYGEILLNPNLTLEYVNKYFDKISLENFLLKISNNDLLKNPIAYDNYLKKINKRKINRIIKTEHRLCDDLIFLINLYW